ncbi:MAG TPA: GNAT family N-acetyltransferase [Steroidobacteraceae bacterium]|nr:GNAT family N-acetyltransferase [Steroidobacteraceae bacterium]
MTAEVAKYSALESLRNGQQIEIRALRPSDEPELHGTLERTSGQSLYRRFFAVKRDFSPTEVSFFLNVDFVKHVALVAAVRAGGREMIVGGGRYVVARDGTAELAFTIEDDYQGQGIGSALLRHLVTLARAAGLKELTAEVMAGNARMLRVFEKCGLPIERKQEAEVVHVALRLS